MTDKTKKKGKGADQAGQPYPVTHSTGIRDLDVEADEKYWRENSRKNSSDPEHNPNEN